MKLGLTLAAAVLADGHGHGSPEPHAEGSPKPTMGYKPTGMPHMGTAKPGMHHGDYDHTGDYYDTTTDDYYTPTTDDYQTGRPNGRPNGRPTMRPTTSPGGNGCNAAAMKQWKMAMEHWKEQQRDWEHHFEMWKNQQDGGHYPVDDHRDEYPSGYPSGEWSGDDDWYNHGDKYPSDSTGGDEIWAFFMPIFEYMNSPDFCEMFNLIPAEWDPQAWVMGCHENQKIRKMIENLIENMWSMGKYEFSEQMCYVVGKSMIDSFKAAGMNDWAMHVEWMEEGCNCMTANIYDMIMGNDVDWMAAYNCGQTWYDTIMKMTVPYLPIDENFTQVPEGAEQLLKLWVKTQGEVDYFLKNPRDAVMEWAAAWGISGNEIIDGLRNWEVLLEQYDVRLEAFGFFDKNIYNMTAVDIYELFDNDQGKIDMFYADPSEKLNTELTEDQRWLVNEWGLLDLFESEQAMDPWGETEGVNNYVLGARAYVEAMQAAEAEYGRFVPADHFYAMFIHAGHLREYFEEHQKDHPEDSFVAYAFENYMAIWEMIESWEKPDYMEDMLENHMGDYNDTDGYKKK